MADATVKRLEDFESNHGMIYRARAGLGVSAWGMQVESFPPNFDQYPEHDHSHDGQEEVYVPISGSANIVIDGEVHQLRPGVFVRVGPAARRKIVTEGEGVQLLCLGGTPGQVYEAPAFTEEGAPWPSAEEVSKRG